MSRIESRIATLNLVAASAVLGCSDDDPKPAVEPVSFAIDIHPIFLAKCSGGQCHSVDNGFLPGHGSADADAAYQATQNMISSGGPMVPVYERILARTSGMDPLGYGFMPPTMFAEAGRMPCQEALDAPGCLTTAEYELLLAWVEQGAPP
jgi:hypothetical protein